MPNRPTSSWRRSPRHPIFRITLSDTGTVEADVAATDRSLHPAAPVVLAPMAGVTNAPFRAMCRAYAHDLVYVNEMVMATAVVYRNDKTLRMMTFGPDERPAQPADLRQRPRHARSAPCTGVRRGSRRSRRPQLRLPGGEGDATRRRRRGAAKPRCCGRSCAPRCVPLGPTAYRSPPSSAWACGTTCARTSRPV